MSSTLSGQHLRYSPLPVLIVVILFLFVAGCGEESSTNEVGTDTSSVQVHTPSMSINGVLRTDRRFATLVAALDSTGLDTTLSGAGPFTLLAPPDSAFDELPDGTVPLLLSERRDRLRTILAHHIVDGLLTRSAMPETKAVTTLHGDTLRVVPGDSTLSVGNARVLDGVETANGWIQVVDRVLLPPRSESQ